MSNVHFRSKREKITWKTDSREKHTCPWALPRLWRNIGADWPLQELSTRVSWLSEVWLTPDACSLHACCAWLGQPARLGLNDSIQVKNLGNKSGQSESTSLHQIKRFGQIRYMSDQLGLFWPVHVGSLLVGSTWRFSSTWTSLVSLYKSHWLGSKAGSGRIGYNGTLIEFVLESRSRKSRVNRYLKQFKVDPISREKITTKQPDLSYNFRLPRSVSP